MEARNCRSDRRETGTQIGQIGKTENPLVFFAKTENQMLKNGKSANRNEHQNRKTEVFWRKNRKTDLKNSQNHKTENPNAPSLNTDLPVNLKTYHAIIINNDWQRWKILGFCFRAILSYLPCWGIQYLPRNENHVGSKTASFSLYFRSKHHPPPLWIFMIWLRYYGVLPLEYIYIYICILQTPMVRVIGSWKQRIRS